MNKDFFTKSISLKDLKNIELKGINLKGINWKNIKKRKEIIIGILFVVYIVVIVSVGKGLIDTRIDLTSEYSRKEQRVNALKSGLSEEAVQKQIDELEKEKEDFNNAFYSVTSAEFSSILNDFKRNSPLTWDDKDADVSIMPDKPEYSSYDVFSVYVKAFSGSFNGVNKFLEYVKDYDKIVRLDSINFRRDDVTGNMKGTMKLSFYFKKLTE